MVDLAESGSLLFPPYPPTLPNVLAAAVANFPNREFLVCGENRLTFAQADEASAGLATGLMALGVGKGSRVGILMPNSPDWVLCWLAAARIGALTVPISTFYSTAELTRVLDHADVDTLLMVDRYVKRDYVKQMETVPGLIGAGRPELAISQLPYLRHVVVWGKSERTWAKHGPDHLVQAAASNRRVDRQVVSSAETRVTPADDLLIIYTSGSTAEPKAVIHTHASVIRLCYALEASGWADTRPDDRIYGAVPFFWIGGPNSTILPSLFTGACVVMSASPGVDEVLDTCAREEVTTINAWGTQLRAITERATSRGVVLPKLRLMFDQLDENGQPIPFELIPKPFGMTETFGPHGLEARGTKLPLSKAGAFGRSLSGMERKVVDPETGRVCAPGEPGELYVRGFSLMRGMYKRLPEDTFDRDGFYPTGDRCHVDAEGFLYFEGRFGEMIKTSGANVSPREVEVVLEGFAEIREAVVFGVPDVARGESIVAVVIPTLGAGVDRDRILERLGNELSDYKVPRFLFTMDYETIPRTDSSKVKKNQLKELVLEQWTQLTGTSQ